MNSGIWVCTKPVLKDSITRALVGGGTRIVKKVEWRRGQLRYFFRDETPDPKHWEPLHAYTCTDSVLTATDSERN
jgi:hypothetical protein